MSQIKKTFLISTNWATTLILTFTLRIMSFQSTVGVKFCSVYHCLLDISQQKGTELTVPTLNGSNYQATLRLLGIWLSLAHLIIRQPLQSNGKARTMLGSIFVYFFKIAVIHVCGEHTFIYADRKKEKKSEWAELNTLPVSLSVLQFPFPCPIVLATWGSWILKEPGWCRL